MTASRPIVRTRMAQAGSHGRSALRTLMSAPPTGNRPTVPSVAVNSTLSPVGNRPTLALSA
eukprot:9163813-Alexandrium_andersonii.AAC.1